MKSKLFCTILVATLFPFLLVQCGTSDSGSGETPTQQTGNIGSDNKDKPDVSTDDSVGNQTGSDKNDKPSNDAVGDDGQDNGGGTGIDDGSNQPSQDLVIEFEFKNNLYKIKVASNGAYKLAEFPKTMTRKIVLGNTIDRAKILGDSVSFCGDIRSLALNAAEGNQFARDLVRISRTFIVDNGLFDAFDPGFRQAAALKINQTDNTISNPHYASETSISNVTIDIALAAGAITQILGVDSSLKAQILAGLRISGPLKASLYLETGAADLICDLVSGDATLQFNFTYEGQSVQTSLSELN